MVHNANREAEGEVNHGPLLPFQNTRVFSVNGTASTLSIAEPSNLSRLSEQPAHRLGSSFTVWIVCPCYLDTQSFCRVHEEALLALRAALPQATARFVVVDDSAGNDPELIKLQDLPDVHIVTPPYNLGHQGALVYALRGLENTVTPDDFIVTMDSDGEDRPQDLPKMLAPLLGGRDNLRLVTLAQRTRREEGIPFKVLYACFKALFWTLTGIVMKSGNFVAYRGLLLKDAIFHPHFDQCYSSTFVSAPFQVRTVPLPRGSRYCGKSRMSYVGLIIHGIRMILPFSERVAIRAMIFSVLVIVASLVACSLLWLGGRSFSVAASLVAFGLLLMVVSGFLFTWYSQARSLSLRGLHEYPHRR